MFGKELRSDLIPYMEAHYSTYAVEGDPSASRMHRAMAGLFDGRDAHRAHNTYYLFGGGGNRQ